MVFNSGVIFLARAFAGIGGFPKIAPSKISTKSSISTFGYIVTKS